METYRLEDCLILRFGKHLDGMEATLLGLADEMGDKTCRKSLVAYFLTYSHALDNVAMQSAASKNLFVIAQSEDARIIIYRLQP
jgi:hypothetical protein